MQVVCKAKHCEFMRENICTLENITLEFNFDNESYGAYCSNFKESREHKKSTYLLHELGKNVYLAIRKKVFEDIDIGMIVEELEPEEYIQIIMDNYLYVGSSKAENRFITVNYSVEKGDIYGEYLNYELKEKYIDSIKKYTCDYIRESGNKGTIPSTAIKMINKGINL